MTRLLYLDCPSGVSGDMMLGALLDLGVELAALEPALRCLPLGEWSWEVSEVQRRALRATQLRITTPPESRATQRTLADIERLLEGTGLAADVADRARAVFRRLAAAEARVHGSSIDDVAFHQVGQADAIIDVVGTLLALRELNVKRVTCSALPLAAEGSARSGHGPVPLPAPATLEILSGVDAPIRAGLTSSGGELVTPTGAALVAELATFERPAMRLERIGVGAGSRDREDRPNVLRAWLGRGDPAPNTDSAAAVALRPVVVLTTTIDDMTAEQIAFVRPRLMAAGALDVWSQASGMKKGRSGLQLTVIARPPDEAELARLLLRETTTLGVRVREERRYEAARESRTVQTSLGPVSVKVKRLPGEADQFAPEFEDCARLADQHGLPIAQVFALVQRAAADSAGSS